VNVADLIASLRMHDPDATVVLHDQRQAGWISKLAVAEVQPVRLRAIQEFGVVWLQIADEDATVTYSGVALGAQLGHELAFRRYAPSHTSI
jgi:hypothetical protein